MKPYKTIETGVFYRQGEIKARKIDADNRRVTVTFSTETPVDRYFGAEILSHDPQSVDLGFINSGRAPVLKDHNREQQTGVVEKAYIADRKGRAILRFGESELARAEFSDVQSGIRSNVSVGYQVKKMIDEGNDLYRVAEWQPLEISIVAIPADTNAYIERANNEKFETKIYRKRGFNTMPDNIEVVKDERTRVDSIMTIADAHDMPELCKQAIRDGWSSQKFNNVVLDKLAERSMIPVEDPTPVIGLTQSEKRRFSLVKLLRSMADPGNQKLMDLAGFEYEASRAVEQKLRQSPKGVFIPHDVLTRDLNTTDDSALVGTNLLAGSFIDLLTAESYMLGLATKLDGLVGNVAIPKQTGGATVYWVAEDLTGPTESEPSFGTVTLSPKTVGTYSDITRQMLLQSTPAIDFLIQRDLARSVALGIDLAALHGSGASNQPQGLAGITGIGSVAGGTDGLAPSWDHIIDLESELAVDNAATGRLAYITNAKVRGKLKKTAVESGYPDKVWDRKTPEKPLNGYPAFVTNQVASNLDKGTSTGVCSAIFFGNWADLIVGLWGALDLLVDPYTYSAAGGLRIRALQSCDIAVRHPESFAAMLDALTN